MAYFLDPATFGNPQRPGYSFTDNSQFTAALRTRGSGTFRLRDNRATRPVRLEWVWTEAQMLAFRQAWENPGELNYGNAWFELILRMGRGENGNQYDPFLSDTRVLAHFINAYSAELLGVSHWRVNASVEVDAYYGVAEAEPFKFTTHPLPVSTPAGATVGWSVETNRPGTTWEWQFGGGVYGPDAQVYFGPNNIRISWPSWLGTVAGPNLTPAVSLDMVPADMLDFRIWCLATYDGVTIKSNIVPLTVT